MKDGDKIKVVITLEAELITTLPSVTNDQLVDLMFSDPAYGKKSIVVGCLNKDTKDDHDTEILLDTTQITIKKV